MSAETFVFRSRIDAAAEEVFDWHLRPGAFSRLVPPWQRVRMLHPPTSVANGARAEFDVAVGPFWRHWTAEHRDFEPGRQFRDVQTRGPFASWDHCHKVTPDGPDACWLEDRIEFAPPGGAIGQRLAGPLIRGRLQAIFAYRHRTTVDDLEAHRQAKRTSPMKILVSGATGLIGSSLVPFLTTGGHSVTRLSRAAGSADSPVPTVRWDPVLGTVDREQLEDFDAFVHLAGENIASGRWTARRKRAIRESRSHGTRTLCEALAKLRHPPKTLVCASAIGYYGNRGDEILDENSPPGAGFLPEVCREWEAAAEPARQRGIRVVHSRFGVVLSPAGGALAKMLTPFKLGLGGKVGSGRQYWSWVAIDDVIGAIHHALVTDSISGPANVVAPNPVTNQEFTKVLGHVVKRPTIFPLPAFMARLLVGEMADDLLLASARVSPRKLAETGYQFRFRDLEPALRHLLGRPAQ